jgi:hypothetical protein
MYFPISSGEIKLGFIIIYKSKNLVLVINNGRKLFSFTHKSSR